MIVRVLFYILTFCSVKTIFNLETTYKNKNDKHKSKIKEYKPNNLAIMNIIYTNIIIILIRKKNLNLDDSYLEIKIGVTFNVLVRLADVDNISLFNGGIQAPSISVELGTIGGRTIE